MGTYVRYPCAHTTKKPLPTVGGFLERLVKRDANPALHVKQAKYAAKSWCLSIKIGARPGLTITHPYRLTCRYSFAKSSMAEAGVESLTFQDGLCAAWRPVYAASGVS